jgi:hypothetical protein
MAAQGTLARSFDLSVSYAERTVQLPRLWLMYFSLFSHPLCPPVISHTHARRMFDRALRTLLPSLHSRIWVRYLLWAEGKGGVTTVSVYRRYLAVDPSLTEHYASILLSLTLHSQTIGSCKTFIVLGNESSTG